MDDEPSVGMLSIEQAARHLNVSVNSVRRLARDSVIPHAKYLGKLRFKQTDLDEYIAAHSYEAA